MGRTHNVVVNEELGYFAAVGAQPRGDLICNSGLNLFDITDPENLISLGCAADDGYIHDAQCLAYHGPDKRYEGRDICYGGSLPNPRIDLYQHSILGYNEDNLTIY